MYLLPLLFPLLNLFISCLLGKFLGKRVLFILIVNMFLAATFSFWIFYEVGINKSVCYIDLGA